MEYIKYIQDLKQVSRPVKDVEAVTIESARTVVSVTLTASGWSSSTPYTQTVSVSGMTADSVFDVGILYPENCTRDNQKTINKAAALIYQITSQDGAVRFRATDKPSTDIPLGLKGVI